MSRRHSIGPEYASGNLWKWKFIGALCVEYDLSRFYIRGELQLYWSNGVNTQQNFARVHFLYFCVTSSQVAIAGCNGEERAFFTTGTACGSSILSFSGERMSCGCLRHSSFAVRRWGDLLVAVEASVEIIREAVFTIATIAGRPKKYLAFFGFCGTRCLPVLMIITGGTSKSYDVCLSRGHNWSGWMPMVTRRNRTSTISCGRSWDCNWPLSPEVV